MPDLTAFDRSERLSLLQTEMEILQDRFDKYDDLVWRNRDWMITVTAAFVGWAISQSDEPRIRTWLLLIATCVPVLFLLNELLLRWFYSYKYIVRYRTLRRAINPQSDHQDDTWLTIPLYDVTNHIGGRSKAERRRALWQPAAFIHYLAVIILVLIVAYYL